MTYVYTDTHAMAAPITLYYTFFFSTPQQDPILATIQQELQTHFDIRPTVITQNYLTLSLYTIEQLRALARDYLPTYKSLVARASASPNPTQPLPLIPADMRALKTTFEQDTVIDRATQVIAPRAPLSLKSWCVVKNLRSS